jgi:hypothetical protein
MNDEMIVCIPGTWESRKDFLESIVLTTNGDFMFAGMILFHPKDKDHVELEFCEPYDQMAEAFAYAGQGKLTDETINTIARHKSVVYLHFPLDIESQRLRLAKFTEVISRSGGIAVKLETSGIAHEWERWFSLLRSENPFDHYCASVVLTGDERHYYSCGMHNFGLPDVQISRSFDMQEAADLMNQFNYYQIVEKPSLESGHTFSLTADSPRFRIELLMDERHPDDDLFHNPHGLWDLTRV